MTEVEGGIVAKVQLDDVQTPPHLNKKNLFKTLEGEALPHYIRAHCSSAILVALAQFLVTDSEPHILYIGPDSPLIDKHVFPPPDTTIIRLAYEGTPL